MECLPRVLTFSLISHTSRAIFCDCYTLPKFKLYQCLLSHLEKTTSFLRFWGQKKKKGMGAFSPFPAKFQNTHYFLVRSSSLLCTEHNRLLNPCEVVRILFLLPVTVFPCCTASPFQGGLSNSCSDINPDDLMLPHLNAHLVVDYFFPCMLRINYYIIQLIIFKRKHYF